MGWKTCQFHLQEGTPRKMRTSGGNICDGICFAKFCLFLHWVRTTYIVLSCCDLLCLFLKYFAAFNFTYFLFFRFVEGPALLDELAATALEDKVVDATFRQSFSVIKVSAALLAEPKPGLAAEQQRFFSVPSFCMLGVHCCPNIIVFFFQ